MKNCFTTSLAFMIGLMCFVNVYALPGSVDVQASTLPYQAKAFELTPDSSILDLGYYDVNPYADTTCTSGCGEGIAYHEENSSSDDSLSSIPCNAAFMWSGAEYNFRNNECVDVMQCYGIANTEGWHNLAYIEPGEWVKYTVNVQRPGYYEIEALLNPISKMGVEIQNGTESMAYDLNTYNQIQKFNFVSNEASTNEDWKHWSWKSPYLNGAPATVGVLFDQAGLQTITIKFSSYEENQISSMGGDLGPLKFKYVAPFESETDCDTICPMKKTHINVISDVPYINVNLKGEQTWMNDCNEEIIGKVSRQDLKSIMSAFPMGTSILNWEMTDGSRSWNCTQEIVISDSLMSLDSALVNLVITPKEGGSVIGLNEGVSFVKKDSSLTLFAVADSAYEFATWKVDGVLCSTDSAILTLSFDFAHTVEAVFRAIPMSPTSEVENGISVAPDSSFVNISWQKEADADKYRLTIYSDATRTEILHVLLISNDGNFEVLRGLEVNPTLSVKIDDLLGQTKYYYSIETLDSNESVLRSLAGSFATEGYTSVKELNNNASLSVYSGIGSIVLNSGVVCGVSIFNANGILVYKNSNYEGYNVICVPSGIYFVVSSNGESQKVVAY